MFDQTIPASLSELEAISSAIENAFSPLDIANKEMAVYGAQMAVHELLVNVIEHGYEGKGGDIGVRFSAEKHQFTATITERGKRFEQAAVADPNFDDLQVRGFGLYLINELMDDVQYESEQGLNSWRLVKHL